MAFVVFAGQSNMGGPLQNASSLVRAWTPDANTLIWDGGAWVPMQPGVNTGYGGAPHGWGPEVAFALDFRARYPGETLRIVKAVWGGTQLALDPVQWAYDWSPQSPGELLDQTTQKIAAAGAAAGGITPTAVFWGQGEEDGNDPGEASAYGSNLSAFFGAVRQAWLHDPAGKIGFFRIGSSPPFSSTVRAAQAAVDAADPNADSFDANAFPHQGDDLHFSAAGLDMAGDGFFALYAGWRDGGTISPPDPPAPPPSDPGGFGGDDTLIGTDGPDSFGGGAGHDMLRGGAGNDRMSGGDGFDDMHGNIGDDTVAGDAGDDWVVGGQGNDVLFGDDGSDLVYAQLGSDTADGGGGDDAVIGGQANDSLSGGAGDDYLSGDRGDDTLAGGGGADVFHSFSEAGLDHIIDFSPAEGDRLRLEAGSIWSAAQSGDDAVVSVGAARIVLVGVALADLSGDWLTVG